MQAYFLPALVGVAPVRYTLNLIVTAAAWHLAEREKQPLLAMRQGLLSYRKVKSMHPHYGRYKVVRDELTRRTSMKRLVWASTSASVVSGTSTPCCGTA